MQVLRIASTLGLAAAAISGYAAYRRRSRNTPGGSFSNEPLQRWESEGGSDPSQRSASSGSPGAYSSGMSGSGLGGSSSTGSSSGSMGSGSRFGGATGTSGTPGSAPGSTSGRTDDLLTPDSGLPDER